VRGAIGAAVCAAAILAAWTALADGAAGMAFASDRAAGGGALGSAGVALFAGGCAALVAIVALLAASHAMLGRCAASLDVAERALPEEGER
jgi:hypothetical protein